MMKLFRMTGICVALCLLTTGCREATDTTPTSENDASRKLEEVTLLLNWFPEAEHGGFYAALEHGFFADEGLDVEILPGGPNSPVIQQVASKRVQFGISNADQVLLGRAQEADVVAVMAPLQVSPRCILVHRESGITKLEDLKNVTLALSNTSTFAQFLKTQMDFEGVQFVPYSGNVAQFLLDKNYAQQAYVFSEPFLAKQEGADPEVLMVSESGFNPYTSVLLAHGKTVDESPSLVQKMVRASIKGWQAYLDDPKPTNTRINSLNEDMTMEVLAFGAEALKPLCITEEFPRELLGNMTSDRWTDLADQLVHAGVLERDEATAADAFTDRFLEKNAD